LGQLLFVQHVAVMSCIDLLPLGRKSTNRTPSASQKTIAVILHTEWNVLNYFIDRESLHLHIMEFICVPVV
jgi:hypothetical protein